jgi:hypothetical protein
VTGVVPLTTWAFALTLASAEPIAGVRFPSGVRGSARSRNGKRSCDPRGREHDLHHGIRLMKATP